MSIRLFLRQQQRNLKRTLLNILLLTAAIAFFVMSMDLYINLRPSPSGWRQSGPGVGGAGDTGGDQLVGT